MFQSERIVRSWKQPAVREKPEGVRGRVAEDKVSEVTGGQAIWGPPGHMKEDIWLLFRVTAGFGAGGWHNLTYFCRDTLMQWWDIVYRAGAHAGNSVRRICSNLRDKGWWLTPRW